MKKHLFTFILALALCFTLAACGDSSHDADDKPETIPQSRITVKWDGITAVSDSSAKEQLAEGCFEFKIDKLAKNSGKKTLYVYGSFVNSDSNCHIYNIRDCSVTLFDKNGVQITEVNMTGSKPLAKLVIPHDGSEPYTFMLNTLITKIDSKCDLSDGATAVLNCSFTYGNCPADCEKCADYRGEKEVTKAE